LPGELMLSIQKGRPTHCVEDVTGTSLAGTLLIAEGEIRADIYGYNGPFRINGDGPVYLISETGQVVSFHDNVQSGLGTTTNHGRTIYHQGLISNVAVVGHDRWDETDKVKRVSFAVKHSMELLRHGEKVKALGSTKIPLDEDRRIFEDHANGMTLRAWYGASYGMEFDAPKELWPTLGIEFDEPQGIHEFIKSVSYYLDFLSFCLGVKLKPDNIRIDRLSNDEMTASLAARTYQGSHEVHYVWPEEEINPRDLWVGGSPVRAWNEEELGWLRACLVEWMNRVDLWGRSYVMMMTSFGLRSVISAERLINACRWFEDIPIARSQNVLSEAEVDAISAAAASKAEELGHGPILRERIASAVKRVRSESAEEQFTRLVTDIERKFGRGIMPNNAVLHLRRAISFRGKTAHGHFDPEGEKEYRAFSKSTRAMEALCYLLTALELPISAEGIHRVKSNPVVRDYLQAYE
jgi:hypothetical protein